MESDDYPGTCLPSASAALGPLDIDAEIDPIFWKSFRRKIVGIWSSKKWMMFQPLPESGSMGLQKSKRQGLPGARTQNLLMTDGLVVVRRLTIGPTDP